MGKIVTSSTKFRQEQAAKASAYAANPNASAARQPLTPTSTRSNITNAAGQVVQYANSPTRITPTMPSVSPTSTFTAPTDSHTTPNPLLASIKSNPLQIAVNQLPIQSEYDKNQALMASDPARYGGGAADFTASDITDLTSLGAGGIFKNTAKVGMSQSGKLMLDVVKKTEAAQARQLTDKAIKHMNLYRLGVNYDSSIQYVINNGVKSMRPLY